MTERQQQSEYTQKYTLLGVFHEREGEKGLKEGEWLASKLNKKKKTIELVKRQNKHTKPAAHCLSTVKKQKNL